MGREQGDADAGPPPSEGADEASHIAGELLVELGRKIAEYGEQAVRIVTVDELEREQLAWYRAGWEERGRLAPGDQESGEPARLLKFPDREAPSSDDVPERHDRDEDPSASHPLPLVGASDANVRELMPHRPKERGRRRPERD